MRFESYDQLKEYMNGLGLFSMDLGLGRMERFWAAAGLSDLPQTVHIVGTNGKGSTSTFVESIARAHGLTTGLFTSPHFVTPRERIRINGLMLGREVWVRLANQLLATPGGTELTYFEFQTCLAMLAFREAEVDLAVMEAGLGGRFDATNVFSPGLTVFTPIGMDHEGVLGETLSAIAGDKAGAMRRAGTAVTTEQQAEAMLALEETAGTLGARLVRVQDVADTPRGALGLRGPHQRENARLASAAWKLLAEELGIDRSLEAEAKGLAGAFIPGRLQLAEIKGQNVILDGAHNVHALSALREALAAEGMRPGCVVFGCMADKNVGAMLPFLESMTDGVVLVTRSDWDRAASPDELAAGLPGRAEPVAGVAQALERALELPGPVLVCGSLYLLGDVYSLYPKLLEAQPA